MWRAWCFFVEYEKLAEALGSSRILHSLSVKLYVACVPFSLSRKGLAKKLDI
jgi:hypothetical protein